MDLGSLLTLVATMIYIHQLMVRKSFHQSSSNVSQKGAPFVNFKARPVKIEKRSGIDPRTANDPNAVLEYEAGEDEMEIAQAIEATNLNRVNHREEKNLFYLPKDMQTLFKKAEGEKTVHVFQWEKRLHSSGHFVITNKRLLVLNRQVVWSAWRPKSNTKRYHVYLRDLAGVETAQAPKLEIIALGAFCLLAWPVGGYVAFLAGIANYFVQDVFVVLRTDNGAKSYFPFTKETTSQVVSILQSIQKIKRKKSASLSQGRAS